MKDLSIELEKTLSLLEIEEWVSEMKANGYGYFQLQPLSDNVSVLKPFGLKEKPKSIHGELQEFPVHSERQAKAVEEHLKSKGIQFIKQEKITGIFPVYTYSFYADISMCVNLHEVISNKF